MDKIRSVNEDYAEDVVDLQAARRIIAQLRRELAQRAELGTFDDGEFTVFLDDEHSEMLLTLFEQRRLVAGQSASCELHDALSDFVSHWLDAQWNTSRSEQERGHKRPRYLTPSA
jgi:hypothetical protein